jgi:ADP-ribose 1''-phosphate phosphatase
MQCVDRGHDLLGKCVLIPPQQADYELRDRQKVVYSTRIWIACLFTSRSYGKRKASPGDVLAATKTALEDLRSKLEAFGPSNFDPDKKWTTDDKKPGRLLSVKFNSGNFGVPWKETELMLASVFGGFERPVYVFEESVVDPKRTKYHLKGYFDSVE